MAEAFKKWSVDEVYKLKAVGYTKHLLNSTIRATADSYRRHIVLDNLLVANLQRKGTEITAYSVDYM